MTTRRCSCCGETKAITEFGVNRAMEDGLHYKCKGCVREANRLARERHPDKGRVAYEKCKDRLKAEYEQRKAEWAASPEGIEAQRAKDELSMTYSTDRRVAAQKAFNSMKAQLLTPVKAVERVQAQEADRQRRLAYRKQRLANNPGIGHERHAKKTKWSNWADFTPFYVEARLLTLATGIQWDVEHIYPLRADWVCGLHTPANLRVMPHRMNRAKDVKVDIRFWPETWLDESMVFDPNNHPDGWLECFATTSGEKHIGITASDLLHDIDEALAHDMVHRLAD